MLFAGQVLDGWHRYTIALEIGAEHIPIEELAEDADPRELVRGRMRGRNMNASQLALAEVRLNDWRADGINGASLAPGATDAATNEQMAEQAGVSPRTIRHAKAVAQATEAVQKAVEEGKMSAKRGAEIAKLPPEQQPAAVLAPVVTSEAPDVTREDVALSTEELLEDLQRENEQLQELVKAAEATDQTAEAVKWRRMFQGAESRQAELMQMVADREAELKRFAKERSRIAAAVGCEDMRNLVSMVEAMARRVAAEGDERTPI